MLSSDSAPTKFQFLAASKCQSDRSGFNLNTEIRWKSTYDGTHVEENPFEYKVFIYRTQAVLRNISEDVITKVEPRLLGSSLEKS